MKKNFSFLYLLPQLFFSGLFLLALIYGLWDSFSVEGRMSIAHYKEIFSRGETIPSIFYTLRISFDSLFFFDFTFFGKMGQIKVDFTACYHYAS